MGSGGIWFSPGQEGPYRAYCGLLSSSRMNRLDVTGGYRSHLVVEIHWPPLAMLEQFKWRQFDGRSPPKKILGRKVPSAVWKKSVTDVKALRELGYSYHLESRLVIRQHWSGKGKGSSAKLL